jgi:hypothetical protein
MEVNSLSVQETNSLYIPFPFVQSMENEGSTGGPSCHNLWKAIKVPS